jgi:hypothetical protein
MELRDVGSGRDRDARFRLVASLQIVLRQPLSDLAGSDANHRVFIGVVARVPLKHGDAQTPFS